MLAEILSVGTELLMGQIANTDAQYLSRRLSELGIPLYRHTTVGDNPGRVKDALREALARCDLVITTGGLGPTEDDLTKEMAAEVFGRPMEMHAPSLRAIEAFMARGGYPMADNNRKQALMPVGALVLENPVGTAPGCVIEQDGKAVAVLPGPPRELRAMFEGGLAPWLAARSGQCLESRFIRTAGIRESDLENRLRDLFHSENPTLALYCAPGQVTARLTARGDTPEAARNRMAPVAEEIYRRVGDSVYGEGMDLSIEEAVFRLLDARRETVSFAESCTAGLLPARLVGVPGASNVLGEAHVTYSDDAKHRVLGVRRETLERFTAVSAQTAREMAEGARRISSADWAAATTGYAGPGPADDGTPAGTVYIAVAGRSGTAVREHHFPGDRAYVRTTAATMAFDLLRREIEASGRGQ